MLKNFVEHLKRKNFSVCAVYLLDSQVCGSLLRKYFLLSYWLSHIPIDFLLLYILIIIFVDSNNIKMFSSS